MQLMGVQNEPLFSAFPESPAGQSDYILLVDYNVMSDEGFY